MHRRWTSESETFVKQDYAEPRGLAWFRLVLDSPSTLIARQQAHPASQGQRLNPDVRHSARPTGDGTTLKESRGLTAAGLVKGVRIVETQHTKWAYEICILYIKVGLPNWLHMGA